MIFYFFGYEDVVTASHGPVHRTPLEEACASWGTTRILVGTGRDLSLLLQLCKFLSPPPAPRLYEDKVMREYNFLLFCLSQV